MSKVVANLSNLAINFARVGEVTTKMAAAGAVYGGGIAAVFAATALLKFFAGHEDALAHLAFGAIFGWAFAAFFAAGGFIGTLREELTVRNLKLALAGL